MTAIYASNNGNETTPTVVDLRMALQYMGALLPEKPEMEQFYVGMEDARGTEDFVHWFDGRESQEIRRVAREGDDEEGFVDYLLGKHHGFNGVLREI